MTIAFHNPRRTAALIALSLSALALTVGCDPQSQPGPKIVQNLPEPRIGMRPIQPGHEPSWNETVKPQPVPSPKPAAPKTAQLPPADGPQAWVPPGGISGKWNCIVIHHSANDRDTPQGMAEWHVQRGWDELGYHFVIGNGVRFTDGEIWVGSRWPKQKTGAHCKVPGNYYNEHGIGICLIGDLNNHGPTPKQMESLTKLVVFLSRRCNIPPERIFTHGGVTHKTECPGRNFKVATIRNQVARQTNVTASAAP